MVTLTVWMFPLPDGAATVVKRLQTLAVSELIRFDDAAMLAWPRGRPVPCLKLMTELPRIWMLDDAFWGMLVGALFYPDRLDPGAAGGSSIGEVFTSLGLSPALLDRIRAVVVEGTSSLLLLIEPEVMRRIHTAFEGMSYTLVEAPLSIDQQQWLRSTFSAHMD